MMKKRWILLMMCACISGLGGCGKQTVTEKAEETETADSMKEDTTELCAYIKEINGNTLVIDPVEYISSGDSDRLASYKHTDDDMPDGYYIYNKDEKTEEVTDTRQFSATRLKLPITERSQALRCAVRSPSTQPSRHYSPSVMIPSLAETVTMILA